MDYRMEKVKARQEKILAIMESMAITQVVDLANELDVTMETIRKDLNTMERQGLIVRIRGGAALRHRTSDSVPYEIRKTVHKSGKLRIAKAACRLIQEGDSILLEGSTTNMALCRELLEQSDLLRTLTIVTNSVYIAQLFELGARVKGLFLLSGWLSPTEGTTQGSFTNAGLQNFHIDKVFLSGAALNEDLQLSAYYENDMLFQQHALRCARKTIVLLDQGKYPVTALYAVSNLQDVDCLVTDSQLDEKALRLLEEKRVQLVTAKPLSGGTYRETS